MMAKYVTNVISLGWILPAFSLDLIQFPSLLQPPSNLAFRWSRTYCILHFHHHLLHGFSCLHNARIQPQFFGPFGEGWALFTQLQTYVVGSCQKDVLAWGRGQLVYKGPPTTPHVAPCGLPSLRYGSSGENLRCFGKGEVRKLCFHAQNLDGSIQH